MLAGCGGSSSPSKSTASQPNQQVSKATVASKGTSKKPHLPHDELVEISSPAFAPQEDIPVRYTCDGANVSPPLSWKGIPPGTAELALYVIKIKPEGEHLTYPWAVAGINPKLHGLQPGKLPAGAVVGLNSDGTAGYNLCPPKGTDEEYVIVLFALPRSLHPAPNFDPTAQRAKIISHADYQGFLVFKFPRH
jgi:phosphatidylethanolamine-binding protein (PEBP) family uncharacterized protein